LSRPGSTLFPYTTLFRSFNVVMVDPERARCSLMAARHPKAVVVQGDFTDPDVLADLELGPTDAVLALTGWDEVNITVCLVAKALDRKSTRLNSSHVKISY